MTTEKNTKRFLWRGWIHDASGLRFEVLKVPAAVAEPNLHDFLFTRGELDDLWDELSGDGNLVKLSEEMVDLDDLKNKKITLYTAHSSGEAPYYIYCKYFIAMANPMKH